VLLGISAGTYAISKGIQANYEIRRLEIRGEPSSADATRVEP
jgi:hypothetical protein